MSLEPGIGALLALVILGQSLALGGVAAIVLIVSASIGVTLTSSDEATPIPAFSTSQTFLCLEIRNWRSEIRNLPPSGRMTTNMVDNRREQPCH
jgi:hypothetical protein